MRYSTALYLALASGWATEHEAFRPLELSGRHQHSHPPPNRHLSLVSPSQSTGRRVTITPSKSIPCRSTRLFADPHPPDQPPPDAGWDDESSKTAGSKFFLKTVEEVSTPNDAKRRELMQRKLLESRITNDALAFALRKALEAEVTTAQHDEETLELAAESSKIIPAKPFMTPEQQEEINETASRFVQDVLSPLMEVQPGVPSETIKGAALAAAAVALLASKGLVVTSAAGLSAAYIAISQGVVGDVARTIGGIAWDVQKSAAKLIEMANPEMKDISKEMAAKLVSAMEDATEWNMAMQELADKEKAENTEYALSDSRQELSKVLREAETAIEAADAAIADADETMDGEVDAAMILAAQVEAQDKQQEEQAAAARAEAQQKQTAEKEAAAAREEAQRKQREDEEAAAKAETQRMQEELEAAAAKAEAQRKQREDEEAAAKAEAQRRQEEVEAAAKAEAQRKQREDEEAAAKAEAQRRQEEVEAAAAKAEAQRKQKEDEEAAAEAEAQRRQEEVEAAAIAEAQRKQNEEVEAAAQAEAQRMKEEEQAAVARAEARRRQEEAEAAAAEVEAERKQEEEQAAARKKWEAEEAIRREEELQDEERRRLEEEATGGDEEDDDDWLAAVELAQKGMEGKVVGLEEAIQDEKAKARWDAAKDRAQVLNTGAKADDMDEDSDVDLDVDLDVLGRAARAAVEAYEFENGFVDDDDDDISEEDVDFEDLFPGEDLKELAKSAKDAVKRFGEEEFEDGEDDSFQGIDGMVVSSSSNSGAGQSPTQYKRDWSSMTVAKLKDELRLRGLKAYGKKTELISMLEKYDREQFSQAGMADDEDGTFMDFASSADDDDEFFDMEDIDLEELGRQARAAVELGSMALSADFDAEEPSDEVLMQLENEESILLNLSFDDDSSVVAGTDASTTSESLDYTTMTVAQLREELRERGLKSVGKKAELIERLNEAGPL